MSTATESGLQAGIDESTALGPIVVATDGTESADSALHAAATFARHSGAEIVVLTVLSGLPLIAADYGMVIPPIDSDDDRRKALLERVRKQVATLGREAAEWRIELRH